VSKGQRAHGPSPTYTLHLPPIEHHCREPDGTSPPTVWLPIEHAVAAIVVAAGCCMGYQIGHAGGVELNVQEPEPEQIARGAQRPSKRAGVRLGHAMNGRQP